MKTILVVLAAALVAAPSFASMVFNGECIPPNGDGEFSATEQMVIVPFCPRYPWDPRYGPEHDDPTIFISNGGGGTFSFLGFDAWAQGFIVRSSKGGTVFTHWSEQSDGTWCGDTCGFYPGDHYTLGDDFKDISWASVLFPQDPNNFSYFQPGLFNLQLVPTPVDAPGTALLVSSGLMFLAITRRKHRSKQS